MKEERVWKDYPDFSHPVRARCAYDSPAPWLKSAASSSSWAMVPAGSNSELTLASSSTSVFSKGTFPEVSFHRPSWPDP
ncbi:hypothetical protein CBS12448_5449 [Aspergillus niger]|nr:hypothetical protein CBS12448_5449 [Aspergillus niger]